MRIHLTVWRQSGPDQPGRFVNYTAEDVSPDQSFLEMIDVVNERLIEKGEEPIAFDSDCREGICGTCGFMISGIPHGSEPQTTVCQLHMRKFSDGDSVTLEPWRAKAFPVLKDLIVDRSSFDRIIQAGGYTSVNTGGAQDANAILIPKVDADAAMDSAAWAPAIRSLIWTSPARRSFEPWITATGARRRSAYFICAFMPAAPR